MVTESSGIYLSQSALCSKRGLLPSRFPWIPSVISLHKHAYASTIPPIIHWLPATMGRMCLKWNRTRPLAHLMVPSFSVRCHCARVPNQNALAHSLTNTHHNENHPFQTSSSQSGKHSRQISYFWAFLWAKAVLTKTRLMWVCILMTMTLSASSRISSSAANRPARNITWEG